MKLAAIKTAIGKKLPLIVLILCVIQPMMDVISYFISSSETNNTVTLTLRLTVLAVIFLLGFMLSEKKLPYAVTTAVLLIFTACHVVFCVCYGYESPFTDISNLIRIYSLPVTTLSFVTFLRHDEKCFFALKKAFVICLFIIVAVQLLSVITGTNPYSYPNKSIGILGWFYFANSQSAILSMIVPVAVAFIFEQKKLSFPTVAATLVGAASLYFLATRLAYAALLGTMLALALACLIIGRINRVSMTKTAVFFAAVAVITTALYGISPMTENQRLVAENAEKKQIHIDSLVAEDAALHGDGVESLRSAYEYYLPGPTARFGLSRTAELYEYSTDVDDIADVRRQKISYCTLLMEDRPLSRTFGLSLTDMTYNGVNCDVENDFHGIYYLCGIVGLILMIAFFSVFAVRAVRAAIVNFKKYFTLELVSFGISAVCGIVHSYFTAGVLRRPNASFYLAIVLAAMYVITDTANKTKTGKIHHEQNDR